MVVGAGASRGNTSKGGLPAPRPSPTPMGRIMFLLWLGEWDTALICSLTVAYSSAGFANVYNCTDRQHVVLCKVGGVWQCVNV